jgi:CHAT domain-containing protein
MHSSLLLAAPGRRCHDPVTASDLYGLETRAGLVVLGACLSGLHGRRAGDELIGLARAFFHAGTPSLIASLWALDDLATSFLFSRFYDHLCAGMSKSRALAEAQLHVSRISKEDVLDRIRKLQGDATLRADARASLECEKRRIDNTLPAELPYANPTYWAAPTLIGVGF